MAPSVTPYKHNNPAYRIYEVDSTTFQVVDYHVYFFDLGIANGNGHTYTNPTWEFLYSAKVR